jgi:hypothetical protein
VGPATISDLGLSQWNCRASRPRLRDRGRSSRRNSRLEAKTSNVLVWITKFCTTDGESRAEISDITLQAAA